MFYDVWFIREYLNILNYSDRFRANDIIVLIPNAATAMTHGGVC